jgi:hypothetical protein
MFRCQTVLLLDKSIVSYTSTDRITHIKNKANDRRGISPSSCLCIECRDPSIPSALPGIWH